MFEPESRNRMVPMNQFYAPIFSQSAMEKPGDEIYTTPIGSQGLG